MQEGELDRIVPNRPLLLFQVSMSGQNKLRETSSTEGAAASERRPHRSVRVCTVSVTHRLAAC